MSRNFSSTFIVDLKNSTAVYEIKVVIPIVTMLFKFIC